MVNGRVWLLSCRTSRVTNSPYLSTCTLKTERLLALRVRAAADQQVIPHSVFSATSSDAVLVYQMRANWAALKALDAQELMLMTLLLPAVLRGYTISDDCLSHLSVQYSSPVPALNHSAAPYVQLWFPPSSLCACHLLCCNSHKTDLTSCLVSFSLSSPKPRKL